MTNTSPTTPGVETVPSLRAEFRSWLRPERWWHYAFHLLVVLVASAYWLISLLVSRGGKRSFAETILYRPEGDSQLWAVISALSQFNFGDPTDAIKYGQGHTSASILSIAPYALTCAVFGQGGYVVADVLCLLAYFAAVFLFLRVCAVGRFPALVIGSLLTTGVLQIITGWIATAFGMFIDPFGLVAAEHYFPNLLELKIYGTRIQRPIVTETWGVLLMAGLVQVWRDPTRARIALGLFLGAFMGALVQGDPFFVGVLGLTFMGVVLRVGFRAGWLPPGKLLVGAMVGAALILAHFMYQRLTEHPDIPRRLGLTQYDRMQPLFLPGYAPMIRVGVVAAVAGLLGVLAWRRLSPKPSNRKSWWFSATEPVLGLFFTLVLVAAYLAQPIQILLVAKAAQIYHYLHILPTFYGYALIILIFHIVRLTAAPQLGELVRRLAHAPGWAGAAFLAVVLVCALMLATEKSIKRIYHQGTVRGASTTYEPWGKFGDDYRASLTKMDLGLSRNPKFSHYRTFATFNLDVYALMTAFHGKRAFNPDVALSILTDAEIEDRLCILGKIFDLTVEDFMQMIQRENIKNYFLGSNKYRFSSDYRFSADTNDYNPALFANFLTDKRHQQWGWILAIPKSELRRMGTRYLQVKASPSILRDYPDMIILDHNEVSEGLRPSPRFYRELATNQVFRVYGKVTP